MHYSRTTPEDRNDHNKRTLTSPVCTRGRQTRFPRTSLCTEQVGSVFHSRGSWRSVQGKARGEKEVGGLHSFTPAFVSYVYSSPFFFFPSPPQRRSSHTQTARGGRRAWSFYLPCVRRACSNPSMTHVPPLLHSVESPPVGSGCVSWLEHRRKPALVFCFVFFLIHAVVL